MAQQQQQQQQQQQRDLMEQTGNQIVHIRGDSDSDLEALFNAVMNPSDTQVPLTVPMRLRKLPNSFFKPPDTGSKTQQQQPQQQQPQQPSPISHSRESSADSTQAANAQPPSAAATGGATAAPNPGLPIHHPRAHSSPASLQQNLVVGNQQHQHLRQQSYDITDDIPLPAGWEMASTPTGQRYFLNHNTQTTQWEDPRKKMSASAMNLHTTPSSSPSPPINPLSSMNLGPLPDGWEQASTPEGEIYFINHQARTTSWFDPRIPMQMQRPALLHAQQNTQPPSQIGRTSAPLPPPASNQMSIQQRQQRARLQRLEMERERLQSRQREIVRQLKVSTLNPYAQMSNNGIPIYNMDEEQQRLQQDDVVMTPQEMLIRQTIGEGIATSPTTDLPPATTTGMDPFLGSNEFHSRQESTDSGLGMGTNYSLPHTPEDYLSTMDDSMEPTSDTDGSSTGQHQAGSDLGSLDLQSSDLNNLGDNNNMDSDDLEPSLQEELGSDILNDVEALLTNNRMDSVLTWL